MEVYKAINKVQEELSKEGISKNRTNTQGSSYKFRGIDDVYNAISPLLAKHGLCILPRFLSRLCDERESQAGKALFYVTVEGEFDFVSSTDGSKHTVKTYGEAMDSGDKATNKAMSAAYKYACMQAFSIPTEGDNDADAQTHEVQSRPFKSTHRPVDGAFESMTEERKNHIREVAVNVAFYVNKSDKDQALKEIEQHIVDNDEKVALWSLLDSKVRSALKK